MCLVTSTASRSAADMLDVGWPDPALVEERIESTRSWAARSATVSRPNVEAECVVVMCGLPSGAFEQRYSPSEHAVHRPAEAGWGRARPAERKPPQLARGV